MRLTQRLAPLLAVASGALLVAGLIAAPALAGHAKNAWVVRGDETEYASDHYPLRADLDL